MSNRSRISQLSLALVAVALPLSMLCAGSDKANKEGAEITGKARPVLWQEPKDIESRDLVYGAGGKSDEPHPPFTFIEEDMAGTNPKFVVKDADGVKWKVKLGTEVRPETVASRLIWAVGYFTSEDYYIPTLQVAGMPHLHRGSQYVQPDGSIRVARLKRYPKGEKKAGDWDWRKNPFTGTRELNGLRVMMALVNNWDLKNDNNAIIESDRKSQDGPVDIYLVSDLGASFATTGFSWTRAKSKGNMESFYQSQFIDKETPEYVDFGTPSRPALDHLFNLPDFGRRVNMEWIGKHVPREDARWIGDVLGKLSPAQIQDAFRAAGYDQGEGLAFSRLVERRIAELKGL